MEKSLQEIYVSVNGENEFTEIKKPCRPEVTKYFKDFAIDIPSVMDSGYRTEVNLRIKKWLREISEILERGFVLTVDRQHQVIENPYINIGNQDMTAHINFSALKKWGEEQDLSTIGFAPQGSYLISLGIGEVMADMPELISDVLDIPKIKGLLLPEGMGESHKVMVQYKGREKVQLRGFALRNRMKYL